MMERRQIVKLWKTGGAGVLATLVRVEGSSYRQAGARLLTGQAPGEYAGTVSGGCLEAEVVRKAAWMVQSGAHVQRYSMLFDDTEEIPFGLGCGGTVDLLLEPAGSPEAEALFTAMERSLAGEGSRVISFLPGGGRGLRRLVLASDDRVLFSSAGLTEEKIGCAAQLTPGLEYDGRFVEQFSPPERLFIFGAGDDARPVARLGALLGWSVLVADGRAQLARADRFPEAEQVFTLEPGQSLHEQLGVGAHDSCVIMTHSYEQDRTLLKALLPLRPRYLGILGSRHRSSLLITEGAEALGMSVEEAGAAVFAPVGLDLGGDGPEAIALSIVSEVQALHHGRLGNGRPGSGPLRRLTPAEIRRQVEQGGSAQYLQVQCALADGG